jgi:hypothetical protein
MSYIDSQVFLGGLCMLMLILNEYLVFVYFNVTRAELQACEPRLVVRNRLGDIYGMLLEKSRKTIMYGKI